MPNIRTPLLACFAALLVASCNLYQPFAGEGSTQDILDTANQCLHDGDYDCAISAYGRLDDSELRGEKICLAYIAKGGLTLSSLVNVITENDSTMLGRLAQTLLPWSAAKSAALDSAKEKCVEYGTSNRTTNPKIKTLVKTLALMSHCAIRIAKTDTLLGANDGDTTCTTPGNQDGEISSSDIGSDGSGSITGAGGMCTADVDACSADIIAIPENADFEVAGLNDIQQSYESIPAALRDATVNTSADRLAIKNAVAP